MKISFINCLIMLPVFLVFLSPAWSQSSPEPAFEPGVMRFDKVFWGPVGLTIPVENRRNDSVRVSVELIQLFHDHYISGLERFITDTVFIVLPLYKGDFRVFLEMQPSYGQAVVRVNLDWRYFNAPPDEALAEPISQIFRGFLKVPDGAIEYINQKYSAGPVYTILDHQLINLDFGRAYMFETVRGKLRSDIVKAFEVSDDYVDQIHRRLVKDGFFPVPGNEYIPGVMAVKEEEAYKVKKALDISALPAFSSWYDAGAGATLDQLMKNAGIIESARIMPALKMGILLHLLIRNWINEESAYRTINFRDKQHDLSAYNRPMWIIEGGEFFLPELCHAAFEENGLLHLATFSPNPELPYEKATIFNMRRNVAQTGEAVPAVAAVEIRQVIDGMIENNIIDGLSDDFKRIILTIRPEIKKFKAYQAPYLADYVFRYVLGAYFSKHSAPEGWIDCVRVQY